MAWQPKVIEVVAGRLWLSDRPTAVDLCTERGAGHAGGPSECPALAMGIRSVISIGTDSQRCRRGAFGHWDKELIVAAGLHGLKLAWDDDDIVPLQWIEVASAFHRCFGATLLNCNAGHNRSRAVVACLAATHYGQPAERTYAILGAAPYSAAMRDLVARWTAEPARGEP